jgi:hypothetical protein
MRWVRAFYSLLLYVAGASNYQKRMKYLALPLLIKSSERENKYTIILLISVFVVLIVANGLNRDIILDWSDVEKIVVYEEYAVLGSTITIEYYLVNDRSVDIKVERILTFTTSRLWSSEPNAEKSTVHIDHPSKYIIIPANDRVPCGSETINITKTGQLVVQRTTFPEARIDVLPEYSYVIKLNSEPHLARGGNCYYTIDITMLNEGMSDINVKLENVRIYDITHYNMTVDVRGYDIIPDDTEYVLVPVNSTESIRYVTGEVVHDSIFYVRIEFTLHIHELDKVERISTWLHRKLITS